MNKVKQLITTALVILIPIIGFSQDEASQETWGKSINLIIGSTALNLDQWGYMNRRFISGLEFDITNRNSGFGFFTGITGSFNSESRGDYIYRAILIDYQLGLRKLWGVNWELFHIVSSIGVSTVYAKISGYNGIDDTFGFGGMAELGILVPIGDRFGFGYLYRYSYVVSELAEIHAELGSRGSILFFRMIF